MSEPKSPKERREKKRAEISALGDHTAHQKRKKSPDPKVDFDELLRRAAQPKE